MGMNEEVQEALVINGLAVQKCKESLVWRHSVRGTIDRIGPGDFHDDYRFGLVWNPSLQDYPLLAQSRSSLLFLSFPFDSYVRAGIVV